MSPWQTSPFLLPGELVKTLVTIKPLTGRNNESRRWAGERDNEQGF
jgi:hypothetical protein